MRRRPQTDKELNFDVETAIRVCRQASYHQHALYLAKKFEQHEWYLKIQLEDVNNYVEALEYISRLAVDEVRIVGTSLLQPLLPAPASGDPRASPPTRWLFVLTAAGPVGFRCAARAVAQAEKNLTQYGKTLVNFLPEQTTALVKKLCTEGGALSAGMRAGPTNKRAILAAAGRALTLPSPAPRPSPRGAHPLCAQRRQRRRSAPWATTRAMPCADAACGPRT